MSCCDLGIHRSPKHFRSDNADYSWESAFPPLVQLYCGAVADVTGFIEHMQTREDCDVDDTTEEGQEDNKEDRFFDDTEVEFPDVHKNLMADQGFVYKWKKPESETKREQEVYQPMEEEIDELEYWSPDEMEKDGKQYCCLISRRCADRKKQKAKEGFPKKETK